MTQNFEMPALEMLLDSVTKCVGQGAHSIDAIMAGTAFSEATTLRIIVRLVELDRVRVAGSQIELSRQAKITK